MARDYAKGNGSGKKAPARRTKPENKGRGTKQAPGVSRGRWFCAGLVSGVFLSFLLYLGTLPTPGDREAMQESARQAQQEPPKPRFDFYTLLPEQTIEVEVDPAEIDTPRAATREQVTQKEQYLLQAGSFRQREDAESRRAELVLLGLEPRIEEANGDNGRWFRVYLGPFGSRSTMAKARSLTAGEGIQTLPVKRGSP